jgi:cobalt-zinc-cadmium efflux system protein
MTATHSHSHFGNTTQQTSKRLLIALAITLAFVVIEAGAGLFANSLALLTDAAHNLTDVIALGLSWYAVRLTTRPSNSGKTFGYHRAGILIALINSTTLVVIALGIFYEAFQRLMNPPEVQSGILIGVGLVAVFVNIGTARLVHSGSEKDLNLKSAFVHLMGDVLSTVAAVVVGIIIALTKLNWLDPFVSVFIGLLILWNARGILRESVNILLESTPSDIDMSNMVRDILAVAGVRGVHDLHVWGITQNLRAFSAHLVTDDVPISSGAQIQQAVNEILAHTYNVSHATLQLECVGCEPDRLYCEVKEVDQHEVEGVAVAVKLGAS